MPRNMWISNIPGVTGSLVMTMSLYIDVTDRRDKLIKHNIGKTPVDEVRQKIYSLTRERSLKRDLNE